jgi:hypothetical protein
MLRRHAPDVVSLVFGVLFAGFAAIWVLSATEVIDYDQAWLAGPATLIVAGILGLVVASRPRRDVSPPAPLAATPPTAVPPDETAGLPADDASRAQTRSADADGGEPPRA